MTRINVHLNDVESGFELFPDGSHAVEIQPTCKIKQSTDGGAYVMIIAKCIDGEMEDKMIGWNCSLLPQALWNLKALLEVIEVEWDEEGFELEEMFEKQLIIDVSTRQFTKVGSDKPEPRNQVDGYHVL